MTAAEPEAVPYLTCEACGVHFPASEPGAVRDDEGCDLCPACAGDVEPAEG
jgi:hypothetical protein